MLFVHAHPRKGGRTQAQPQAALERGIRPASPARRDPRVSHFLGQLGPTWRLSPSLTLRPQEEKYCLPGKRWK